mgnify:CR=1 FL=1
MNKYDLKEKISEQINGKGYYLNPDDTFTLDLIESLLINQKRYGYMFCPCRLATGNREEDLDLICPCDYRDQDVDEYGTCYCGLYVDEEVVSGEKEVIPIPERRVDPLSSQETPTSLVDLPYPVYRCKVCGYLAARDNPPHKCPICGVTQDRFERFL